MHVVSRTFSRRVAGAHPAVPTAAPSPRGTHRALSVSRPAREAAGPVLTVPRALMVSSNLWRRLKVVLALLTAVAPSGAVRAHADTGGYPFQNGGSRPYL